jgi:hypothetical protein
MLELREDEAAQQQFLLCGMLSRTQKQTTNGEGLIGRKLWQKRISSIP